jgi:tRNA G46 methylase TrmB
VYRQQASKDTLENVFLVRAELADFWRLWLEAPPSACKVEKHFLLYPNPYPKKRRLQNRWYAHPAFPLIRQLGGDEIVVRSNWKEYLEDFATSMSIAETLEVESNASYSSSEPLQLDAQQEAWTNFEQKYFDVGETCYELKLSKP